MTRKEIVDYYEIEEPITFFDPEDVFDKGILGISEDKKHVIYGYFTLAAALAEDFEKEWHKEQHKEDEEEPDFMLDAFEWIDKNTIGTIPYLDEETSPILIYEMPKEK